MPLIECTLIEGYDAPTRRLVCERITDAACSAIGASPEFVIVTVKEVAPENYMRGRSQKKTRRRAETARSDCKGVSCGNGKARAG